MKKRLITYSLLYLLFFTGFTKPVLKKELLLQQFLKTALQDSKMQPPHFAKFIAYQVRTEDSSRYQADQSDPLKAVALMVTDEHGNQTLHPLFNAYALWQEVFCRKYQVTTRPCCYNPNHLRDYYELPITAKEMVATFKDMRAGNIVLPDNCEYSSLIKAVQETH